MKTPYRITIRSDTNFDNIIAEITFTQKQIGIILSQEQSIENFEIRIFSLIENSKQKFYDTENIDEISIDLDVLYEAIGLAKERLRLLDVPRQTQL